MGIDGTETADQLARKGSSHPPTVPDPALGISAKVARGVIRDWKKKIGSLYIDKGTLRAFLKTLCEKKLGTAQFEQKQLKIMTGLLTGYCHLKGHLFKPGLVNSPECNRRKQASDTHTRTHARILCDCEALAILRFRHPGCHFMKQGH
jgi:hypothetical protein